MRRDSRLSVALHVLLHMSEMDEAVTSETLGPRLRLNPVVVRRTLGGLRNAGIVHAVKGHGGGWSVARPLEEVTLAEVYDALGQPALFGIGTYDPRTACPIEQAVNHTVTAALDDARARLMARLQATTVAEILKGARRGLAKRTGKQNVHA